MFRSIRWLAPVVALGLLVAFTHVTRAADASKDAGSITGTVTGADGKPAASVAVRVVKFPPHGQDAKHDQHGKPDVKAGKPEVVGNATTDANGKFKIDNLPAGDYRVVAKIPQQAEGGRKVTVKAGETAEVAITLKAKAPKDGKHDKNDKHGDHGKHGSESANH